MSLLWGKSGGLLYDDDGDGLAMGEEGKGGERERESGDFKIFKDFHTSASKWVPHLPHHQFNRDFNGEVDG